MSEGGSAEPARWGRGPPGFRSHPANITPGLRAVTALFLQPPRIRARRGCWRAGFVTSAATPASSPRWSRNGAAPGCLAHLRWWTRLSLASSRALRAGGRALARPGHRARATPDEEPAALDSPRDIASEAIRVRPAVGPCGFSAAAFRRRPTDWDSHWPPATTGKGSSEADLRICAADCPGTAATVEFTPPGAETYHLATERSQQ
jgi:hypothetical protein